MTNAVRYLSALAAGLSALNVFILSYPGDVLPQSVLVIVGGASACVAASAAFLSKPE